MTTVRKTLNGEVPILTSEAVPRDSIYLIPNITERRLLGEDLLTWAKRALAGACVIKGVGVDPEDPDR